jgi:tight adherence protein C
VTVPALALGATTALLVLAALVSPIPVAAHGSRAGGRVGRSGTRPRPADLAAAGAAALVLGLAVPPLAVVALGVPALRRRLSERKASADRRRAIGIALPEAVDLLLLCTGAGMTVPLSLPLVAARAPDPVGAALRSAEAAVLAGGRRADALLEHLRPLGDPAAALAHVLVDHLHHGVPVGPGLERAAFELRLARRRRAEEAARRLPVRLLAPLLICVLPAFVLLTIAPLVVAALRSLPR